MQIYLFKFFIFKYLWQNKYIDEKMCFFITCVSFVHHICPIFVIFNTHLRKNEQKFNYFLFVFLFFGIFLVENPSHKH